VLTPPLDDAIFWLVRLPFAIVILPFSQAQRT